MESVSQVAVKVLADLDKQRRQQTQTPLQPPLQEQPDDTCECKGAGYLYVADTAHPSGYTAQRCPVCGPQRQLDALARVDGLSPEMREWTFANTARYTHNARAFDIALQRANQPAWFLTLTGPFGVGKTRLLSCIVNHGRSNALTCVYTTTADLLDHLRATYDPATEVTYDGLWDRIATAHILALDELDRWNPKPWAQEKFFQLIDIRYRHGRDRLTVFATNEHVQAMPGYLQSRMLDKRCAVEAINAPDVRGIRV